MPASGGPWLQFSVTTDQPEPVEAALKNHGACAITLRNANSQEQPVEQSLGTRPNWQTTIVTGLFGAATDTTQLALAMAATLQTSAQLHWHAELVEDQDWVRAWLKDYRPIRLKHRLLICPQGHVVDDDKAVVVHLDPGLAFGSGSHPSTTLCLQWLDANMLTDKTIVDYGCGSGILAVAAARLGARQVWAVDIDPQALSATRSNARNNNVLDKIHIAPATDLPALQADILVANILAKPLLQLAPVFAAALRPGGLLILAGLLDQQKEQIQNAYTGWFAWTNQQTQDGWLRLDGMRRRDAA